MFFPTSYFLKMEATSYAETAPTVNR